MNREDRILRVVIDTNVLLSAVALPRDSPPTLILELARTGRFEAIASPFILGELEKNLARKFGWESVRLQVLRKKLRGFIAIIEPKSRVRAVKGCEADNHILECALDAQADVLVTGDRKDLRPLGEFRGILIRTPREFLDENFPACK